MTDNHEHMNVEPVVGWLLPSDAPQVPDLFRAVYADRYPFRMIYDPARIVAGQASGDYFPFVVRAGQGRLAGYGALYRSAPYPGIVEFGQGVVSPDFRKAGLGRKLFEFVEQSAPGIPGAEMYFGEAVCNHTTTQKAGALIKTIETGIEMDLLPGAMHAAASARVAAVDMFRTFVPKPHTVLVPPVYEEIIRFIYNGFDDSRTLILADGHAQPQGRTEMTVQRFDEVGVARILCRHCGSDFAEALANETQRLDEAKIHVQQFWLSLTNPAIVAAINLLHSGGYFFGGIFPRWFDDDAIMMQKMRTTPDWEGVHLYAERSEKILAAVYADWQQRSLL